MFVTDNWLMTRTGVHRSTVARWRAAGRYPPAVRRLAELEHHGELAHICCHWTGWRLDARDGTLVSPEGERYTPGTIRALTIRSQLVTELTKRPKRSGFMKTIIIVMAALAATASAQPGNDALERNQQILRDAEAQARQTEQFVRANQEQAERNSSRRALEARVAALEREIAALRQDVALLISRSQPALP